jgi:hypothetical protein
MPPLRAVAVVVLAVVVLASRPALAAPGEFRVIDGTLVHPPALRGEPIAQLRGDDGAVYWVDLRGVERTVRGLQAGAALTVAGYEGERPDQISAHLVTRREAEPPASEPEAVEWRRLEGRVQTVSGSGFVLRTAEGRQVAVRVSRLGRNARQLVAPGEAVTVFGFAREDTLLASGLLQQRPVESLAPDPPAFE